MLVGLGAIGMGYDLDFPAAEHIRTHARAFQQHEAFSLLAAGADALKLFPAEAASPSVLRGIRAVLPSATMVLPVGGIDADNMRPWLQAGAAGFGIGSSIYRAGDNAETVAAKAARLVAALHG